MLWFETIGLGAAAIVAHTEAGATALLAAALLGAFVALATAITARAARRRIPYPGRLLVTGNACRLGLLFALVAATFSGLGDVVPGLPSPAAVAPSPLATILLGSCAFVAAFIAWAAGWPDDGSGDRRHGVELDLEDLVRPCPSVEVPQLGTVRIPPGTTHGSRLRVIPLATSLLAPDDVLLVTVRPHEAFTIEGVDLSAAAVVTPSDALSGTTVAVASLDGAIRVKVPPLSPDGSILRCRGLGLPSTRHRRGHLHVVVRVLPDDDWQPYRLGPGIWLHDIHTLTDSKFGDLLANWGHHVCHLDARWPQVLVVRCRGLDGTARPGVSDLLYALNRSARRLPDGTRRAGPMLIALAAADGCLLFPFGDDLRRRVTAALRERPVS